MYRRIWLTVIVALSALALAAAGCGGSDDESSGSGASDEVQVTLDEQNGSGESGTATLTKDGDKTKVVLDLQNPPTSDPQPAHIHKGTCAELDPNPAYALTNVEDGKSETTVDEPLDELTGGSFAVNVHKSEQDIKTYSACGNIGEGGSGASNDDSGGGSGY